MSKDYKPRGAPRGGHPLFTGILIGLFIGLLVAIAVALYVPSLTKDVRAPATGKGEAPVKSAPTKPEAAAPLASEQKKPRFEFYDILPGTEQALPDNATPAAPSSHEAYFLQAGAFQNQADADNLKARLALMGIEATVQSAALPDKGIWHRVRIGPFTSMDEMSRTRALLAENGVQATLVKIKASPPAAR